MLPFSSATFFPRSFSTLWLEGEFISVGQSKTQTRSWNIYSDVPVLCSFLGIQGMGGVGCTWFVISSEMSQTTGNNTIKSSEPVSPKCWQLTLLFVPWAAVISCVSHQPVLRYSLPVRDSRYTSQSPGWNWNEQMEIKSVPLPDSLLTACTNKRQSIMVLVSALASLCKHQSWTHPQSGTYLHHTPLLLSNTACC